MNAKLRFCRVVALGSVVLYASVLWAEELPAEMEATFVDPAAAEAKPYRSAGEYAIDRLVMTMITDSAGAVARNEEVKALPTFHLKDVPMKNGTVAGLPRIAAMKLTSLKLRNPANAADAAEKLALAKVQYGLDSGTAPRVLVQRIALPGGKEEWRVYKPLANIRQCGSCHASPESQTPELRAALQERYPNDEGGGYAPGEWRGLIRVTVTNPPAPSPSPGSK